MRVWNFVDFLVKISIRGCVGENTHDYGELILKNLSAAYVASVRRCWTFPAPVRVVFLGEFPCTIVQFR
jgi:hypothetical protein